VKLLSGLLNTPNLMRKSSAGLAIFISASACADHYGLDRLMYGFVTWCIAAAALLGVFAAALDIALNEKQRKHLQKLFAVVGLCAYFLILGDLWKLPFTFPLYFGFLLLLWAVQGGSFVLAKWLIERALMRSIKLPSTDK
jgi:hypothetical protein